MKLNVAEQGPLVVLLDSCWGSSPAFSDTEVAHLKTPSALQRLCTVTRQVLNLAKALLCGMPTLARRLY